MKRWMVAVLAALTIWSTGGAAKAAPDVPGHIFEWVQSSARVGYFFNRQEISYGGDAEGYVNFDKPSVPTLEIYDDIQIQDVVQKRRWRGESLQGYSNLVGAAVYLSFDLAKGTVTVHEANDLDYTWTPLAKTFPKTESVVASLPEKSFARRFYDAILAYEKENREVILSHTTGVVREADKKKYLRTDAKDKEEKKEEKGRSDKEKQAAEKPQPRRIALLGKGGSEAK